MGATYYVDPAAGGANNGTSWGDAWTTIQTALDTAVPDDVVYCRGTETTAATIDVDTQTGTNAAGFIKFIGCNASGVVDGTRYIINGNAGGYHIITVAASRNMYWMENIETKNTGGSAKNGWQCIATSAIGWILINCCSNNCSGAGFNLYTVDHMTLIRCVAYSNTNDGFWARYPNVRFFFCCSRDNTDCGWEELAPFLFGCISHGNANDGLAMTYSVVINSVIDGNTDDGIMAVATTNPYFPIILGSRITNHSGAGDIGLNANSEPCVTGWCYFENNADDNIQNATLHYNIPLEGGSSSSNIEDQANTDAGYTNSAGHDFSTRYVSGSDPSLRRTAITVPWS